VEQVDRVFVSVEAFHSAEHTFQERRGGKITKALQHADDR